MAYLTTSENNKIYLLSDTHLIARDLHDDGTAFQRMRDTSAGKDLDYQGLALIAFVRKILKEKPAAVIITGRAYEAAPHGGEERSVRSVQPCERRRDAF